MNLRDHLARLPLIAILRGILPSEAAAIGTALVDAGFAVLEVPLNSPQPLDSIAALASTLGDRAAVGAGTVLGPDEALAAAGAGAGFVVAPNFDAAVVRAALAHGMDAMPGVATPSEAFAALACGVADLKLFPAEQIGPAVVKAWRAVLPSHAGLFPVGGITPQTMAAYRAAGASGFGIGSALFTPGRTPIEITGRARAFVDAWNAQERKPA